MGRRWFQYRLRTLLVVVTLICACLGWRFSDVYDRQQMAAWIKDHGGTVHNGEVARLRSRGSKERYRTWEGGMAPARMPIKLSWWRIVVGDVAATAIYLPKDVTGTEVARIAKAFPDADLIDDAIAQYREFYR